MKNKFLHNRGLTFSVSLIFSGILLLGIIFVSCSNDDDNSNTPTSTEPTSTAPTTVINSISDLKVGTSVKYGGTSYLVSKNTFSTNTISSNVSRVAIRAAALENITAEAETDAQIAQNIAYLNTYVDRAFRAEILKEETGIENYVELFPKTTLKENASGYKSLTDYYVYLSETGEKIAAIGVQWKSDSSFIGFFFPDITTSDARAEKFDTFTEDELRLYDPGIVNVTDVETHRKIGLTFSRYSETNAANYGKVNYSNPKTRSESKTMPNSTGKERQVYSISKTEEDGTVCYQLKDNIEEGIIFVSLDTHYMEYDYRNYEGKNINNVNFAIRTQGDGKIGGSLRTTDYKRNVIVNLYKAPINVQDEFGDPKTTRNMISSSDIEYSAPVNIKKQTYNSSTKKWVDQEQSIQVEIPALADGDYCISFATETTTINEITVPASVTYHAHFEKDTSGKYPTKDKYAKVTCYPQFVESAARIVYMLTEESIQDFLNAYINDFSTLPTTKE